MSDSNVFKFKLGRTIHFNISLGRAPEEKSKNQDHECNIINTFLCSITENGEKTVKLDL